ncbi:MAG: MBOAT family protein [Gammaproteobacteria bacterium]|nr:MBOAT family protein [Gammaproteobacteria bacterium]
MLFNSYEFILAFLPITLAVFFFVISRYGHEPAIAWLVSASLIFYAWWSITYLALIILSMLINYGMGKLLARHYANGAVRQGKMLLTIGITANLGALGYFKYANFFVSNINVIAETSFQLETIILPLAISFFTFQQIAYLIDAHKGITSEFKFLHYALFVTFFPQLIAGPIVHHREMLPQFMSKKTLRFNADDLSVGIAIFSIGLFKKVVLADGIAVYASPIFDAAAQGETLTFFEAWGGALAYTMQLYFDFSGYSDMAIGAARMFGIKLPLNFHSPYKATSISEFWRRWHMTLSRFLRDYVYIPLGGNKKGNCRRYSNMMITMLLGGLWHGAGWTFVIWGGLHGMYLAINHGWRKIHSTLNLTAGWTAPFCKIAAWGLTFLCVVVGWVFFRASDLSSAIAILEGMSGQNGLAIPNAIAIRTGSFQTLLSDLGITFYLGGGSQFLFTYLWIIALLFIALFMPNTQEIMRHFSPAFNKHKSDVADALQLTKILENLSTWQPTRTWGVFIAIISAFGLLSLSSVSEFLYFQF